MKLIQRRITELTRYAFYGVVAFIIMLPLHALEFSTAHNSNSEKETIKLIKALNSAHDLAKWQFTQAIHIDEKAIPRSHPVLTLHTRHNISNNPQDKNNQAIDLLLSTYLHENIHWYLESRQPALDKVISALKLRFPDPPVGFPLGARDKYSSYLHLVVCFLELDAVAQLLSDERYKRVQNFWRNDHYTWIYQQVIEHKTEIKQLLQLHKLML